MGEWGFKKASVLSGFWKKFFDFSPKKELLFDFS
jgi:hypothetical protein